MFFLLGMPVAMQTSNLFPLTPNMLSVAIVISFEKNIRKKLQVSWNLFIFALIKCLKSKGKGQKVKG